MFKFILTNDEKGEKIEKAIIEKMKNTYTIEKVPHIKKSLLLVKNDEKEIITIYNDIDENIVEILEREKWGGL